MRDSDAAVTALSRFGLGPRPGDLDRVRPDPVGAVLADLDSTDIALTVGTDDLLESQTAIASARTVRRWILDSRRSYLDLAMLREISSPAVDVAAAPAPTAVFTMLDVDADAASDAAAMEPVDTAFSANVMREEVEARVIRYGEAPLGFTERLVWFWGNHFAIATKDADILASVGAFEREAIRPHVLGRFSDMVQAVARHPAMLLYLDNFRSYGPNSADGQKTQRGLNENYARELLELHTLGVDGGYTQADVTALARILTGWTLSDTNRNGLRVGDFRFIPTRHEPGNQTVLGQLFLDRGIRQGEDAIAFVSQHPATAHHIARKLATYFVADDPPPALVARLERVFLDTDGDLGAVSRALVEAPEAWEGPARKVRPPQEFLIAAWRAASRDEGSVPPAREFIALSTFLGQPLWRPSAPNGFPDKSDAWLSPKGIMDRMTVAERIASRSRHADPVDMLGTAFGESVSPETRQAVMRAESRSQAVAILFMAPEFQWR